MQKISALVLNDKTSIRDQLRLSYSVIIILSVSLTLGICLGLMNSLGNTSYSVADTKITTQTVDSIVAVSVEISNQIGQQLRIVSDTITMSEVLYSSVLIQYANLSSVQGTLLQPQDSFRDYNFVGGCTYPNCPLDYGFMTHSRLPSRFVNGSQKHSSVYLYSGKYQQAVQNDSLWDAVTADSPEVTTVIDALAVQDIDFCTLYTRGGNMSSMYFHTSQIENYDTELVNVVHRTYPGIAVNASAYGNPTNEEWFQKAPINAAYLTGPIQEPLTKQLSIVLSSRKTFSGQFAGQTQAITFVSSAVVTLDQLALAVSSVQYTDSGFGAVMKADNWDMLVWKDSLQSVFDASSETFFSLRHFNPALADQTDQLSADDRQTRHTFQYHDAHGDEWLVSYMPFFTTVQLNGATSYNSLVLLVFSKLDQAEFPLIHLKKHISGTTTLVTVLVVVIVLATVVVMAVLVFVYIQYITSPLPPMMRVAEEIIQLSTADDAHKDYGVITSNPLFKMKRQDEIGLLISDYHQLLMVLQARTLANRDNSQYPLNPFHVVDDEHSEGSVETQHSWRWLVDRVSLRLRDDQRDGLINATRSKTSKRLGPKVIGDPELYDTVANILPKVKPIPVANTKEGDSNSYRRGGKKIGIEGVTSVIEENPAVDPEVAPPPSSTGSDSQVASTNPSLRISDEVLQMKRDAAAKKAESAKKEYSAGVVSGKFDAISKSLPSSKGEASRSVTTLSSLKTQLNSLFGVLLICLVVAMIVAVTQIQQQGSVWTAGVRDDLSGKIVQNLQAIAFSKATYVETSFQQISLGIITSSRFMSAVLNGNLTRPDWFNNTSGQLYLTSKSVDPHNTYFAGRSAVGTHNFSGYYVSTAAKCELTTDNCHSSQNSYNTRLTSLFTLKLRSLLPTGSLLSFMQTGLQSDGTMRYLPYNLIQNASYPITCYHQDLTLPFCYQQYYNSSCSKSWVNPAGPYAKKKYPIYDARCRGWYQLSVAHSTRNSVYFQTPRVADNGVYTQPGGIAIRRTSSQNSEVVAVLTANYLITTLSKSIQVLDYLSEGYVYVVQALNTTVLVVHPNANSKCKWVHCAEGFTADEYNIFHEQVLSPLQNYAFDLERGYNGSTVYIKAGRPWQLVYARASAGSINFILLATVPVSVILQTSESVQSSINHTVVGMITAFIIAIVALVLFSLYYAYELVRSIVDPINELRKVFELVRLSEDLSGQVPEKASSSDMKVLLDAFGKMMVALRFSSESYAAGNQKRTREVFTDALSLYTGNNDKRGIGVSLANLAASELTRKRYDAAEQMYLKSIENAVDILKDRMESREEVYKMERVLSDRRTALASVYLEQQRLDDAMAVLTPAIEKDVKRGYLIGYALKQALIINYQFEQKNLTTAEKVCVDALAFLQHFVAEVKISPGGTVRVLREEVETAEQIALCRLAQLRSLQEEDFKVVEAAYILCLTRNSVMHLPSATKALIALKSIFAGQHRNKDILQLDFLASEFNMNVSRDTTAGAFSHNLVGNAQPPKRILFAADYSEGMAGVTMTSVMDNVNTVFEMHLHDRDSLGVIYFNHKVRLALPPTLKKDNQLLILEQMEKVCAPRGTGCALYDAMAVSLYALSLQPSTQDWLVVVTNSDDIGSKIKLQVLLEKVSQAKIALVIIGVGDRIQAAALEVLAAGTKRGVYFHAQADKKSINEAFEHAIHIINTSSQQTGAVRE